MNSDTRWSAQELRDALTRYEEELRAAGKARNTVNTYVQHPERFINWLEGRYVPVQSGPNWGRGTSAQDAGLRLNSTGPPRYGPASFTPDPPPAGTGVSAGSSRYDPSGGTWRSAKRRWSTCRSSPSSASSVLRSPTPPAGTGPGGPTSGRATTSTPKRGWEPADVRPTSISTPAPWTSSDERAL